MCSGASLLESEGTLLFSTNLRRFKLAHAELAELEIEDITRRTIPPDFARSPRIHNTWLVRRRP